MVWTTSQAQAQENERILECVNRFRKDGDQSAFQELAHHLHGFLQHLALKKFFFVAGCNSDDVYQEGLYALATKVIPDYKQEKGPFMGFAKLCIRRHIITILKSANNGRNRPLNTSLSMDATVCHDEEDGPVPISSFLSTKEEGVTEKAIRDEEFQKKKGALSARLTSLETDVLDLYLSNMSYVDIVKHMNKRRRGGTRVNCKVVDNALCRIKKKAMEMEKTSRLDVD